MKTTLILIGTLFLISSCNCFQVKNDVRRVWSLKFKQCRCQWYSFKNIKSTSKLIPCETFYADMRDQDDIIKSCRKDKFSSKYPELCDELPNEQYCDDLVGFSKTSWADNITPHAKESKRCYEDQESSKRGLCK